MRVHKYLTYMLTNTRRDIPKIFKRAASSKENMEDTGSKIGRNSTPYLGTDQDGPVSTNILISEEIHTLFSHSLLFPDSLPIDTLLDRYIITIIISIPGK